MGRRVLSVDGAARVQRGKGARRRTDRQKARAARGTTPAAVLLPPRVDGAARVKRSQCGPVETVPVRGVGGKLAIHPSERKQRERQPEGAALHRARRARRGSVLCAGADATLRGRRRRGAATATEVRRLQQARRSAGGAAGALFSYGCFA